MAIADIFTRQNREIAILLEKAEMAEVQDDSNTLLVRCRVPFTGPGAPPLPLYYQVTRRISGFGIVLDVRQLVVTSGQLAPDAKSPVVPLYINVALDADGPVVNAWREAVQRTRDTQEQTSANLRSGAARALRLLGIIENDLPA